MFRCCQLLLATALAAGLATTTFAQQTAADDPETALPMPSDEERAAIPFVLQSFRSNEASEARFSALEKALQIASKPTPFRGVIRCQQAGLLTELPGVVPELAKAVQECVSLLPNHPMSQSTYAYYQMARDNPGGEGLAEGVDIITRLLLKYPQIIAGNFDRPFLNSVIRRLRYAGDQRRVASLIDAYLASGIAKSTDLATDELVLMGINALIIQQKWEGANTLLRQLKTRRAVETVLLQRDAEPIWEYAAQYYHGDLELRRNMFDLDSWRSAGGTYGELTRDRIAAMAEHGEWEKLRDDTGSLLTKQIEAFDWERGDIFTAAISAMMRGGRADLALPLGLEYFDKVGEQGNENLNGKLSLGHELVKAGRYKEGMALIEQGYAHWKNNQSMTEGAGGRVFMAAVRSCAKDTAEGEAAFREVLGNRDIVAGAYRAALECRGSADELASYFEERLTGAENADQDALIVELRRIEAGQPERTSPALKKALANKKVIAALDKVSRPWAVATMKSALAKAEAGK